MKVDDYTDAAGRDWAVLRHYDHGEGVAHYSGSIETGETGPWCNAGMVGPDLRDPAAVKRAIDADAARWLAVLAEREAEEAAAAAGGTQ